MNPGTRLGSYEILAPLGAGGMGEVYRARDSKLDREVAIKVLPAALAHDPERLARFEREAKVLAALNHPNIAQIYGVEESNGVRALVMELVPGAPLQGPLEIQTALQYARQIADAIEAAHDKGIIHRDLKPANIMVTPEGVVKVLDFGLAAVAQPGSSSSPENSPTMTMAATQVGLIMGTAAYMSPDQAAGKPVDKRADIWSFGVVLWEMLTGARLFEGETVADTLADVLRAPIDFAKLPEATPRVICDLVKRCLDRDGKRRLRDIGEARVAIQDCMIHSGSDVAVGIGRGSSPHSGVTPLETRKPLLTAGVASRFKGVTPWAAAVAIALIAAFTMTRIATLAFGPSEASKQKDLKPLMRLDVDLGPEAVLGALSATYTGADAILSPDGTRLVFVSKARLFTRRLDQPRAIELVGTEGAYAPFFSPDGQWIGFYTTGKLKKISVEGGAAIALCDISAGVGGSWGEDGNIIAAISTAGALFRIPATGGPPTPVTELREAEATHRWPQILPGGEAVLFTTNRSAATGFDAGNIEVMTFKDKRRKTLLKGGTFGRYLPTSNGATGSGHLTYINQSTMFAVPFDLSRLEIRGTPQPMLDQVSYSTTRGHAQVDFSQSGTLVYRSGSAQSVMTALQWLDDSGKLRPIISKPGRYSAPHISPDGKSVALSVENGGSSDIWSYDYGRDTVSHLTFGDGGYTFPVWSPDGRYIVFHGDTGIYWARADGAAKPQRLTESKYGQYPWSFSPDGKILAFAEISGPTPLDIWTVSIEYDGQPRAGKPEVYLQTPSSELYPAFSPDGRWIAYRSIEAGTSEIYVRAFPDKGGKWQISNGGGVVPVWSKNGRELFYRTPDERIMMVNYTVKGDSFVADKPRLWSNKVLMEPATSQNFDVSPDGKRLAVLVPIETDGGQAGQRQVTFLLNFFDELRRKVPLPK